MNRRSLVIFSVLLLPFTALSSEEPNDVFDLFSEKEEPIHLIAEADDDFFDEDFFEESSEKAKASAVLPVVHMPKKESKIESSQEAASSPLAEIPALAEKALMEEKRELAPKQEEIITLKPSAEKTEKVKEEAKEIASANLLLDRAAESKMKREDSSSLEISLAQVFSGSPIIYSLLLTLSVLALFTCLYSLLSLRTSSLVPEPLLKNIRSRLLSNQYDEAQVLCEQNENFFCKMIAAAIGARQHGLQMMLETMKAEGKRATVGFWQRISLLNDIAIIAPMVGLLGTVLGMFYAFYDLNRSRESVNMLFDGLGISVGSTVAGLIVAILAMMLHALAKYRLMRVLAHVENEAQAFATLIDKSDR